MHSEQLKLFDDYSQLLLPKDLMEYSPYFMDRYEAEGYFNQWVKEMPWQQHKVKMYDKILPAPRLCAWFGDHPIREGDTRSVQEWTPELWALKERLERDTGITFNGVLLNYYRDGNDSVAWHSDKDTVPGLKTEIASVSIGQSRNFDFRSKNNHRQQYSIKLEHGSLLLMKGDLQQYWEHRIAKSTTRMKGRINLTFRRVV
jgi:alkylated DNA repair dioxygenase AlkB